jgi:alpha-mannosidase
MQRKRACVWAAGLLAAGAAAGQSASREAPDLAKEPTLYVVGYAHLDTQWRWEYPRTISEYLPKTMRDNFALFEKYPSYVFNFSGSRRYRMMKEYYPVEYETLKRYVAAGRWFPSGSSVDETDVNSPSAESIVRQVLYGTRDFRRDFGKTSAEYMLPDCFGFPASLPTVLAHMGLKGFSTQKLSWGSAVGIPFNVGWWEGPDGRGIVAALNPGSYSGDVYQDLSKSPSPPADPAARNVPVDWPKRVQLNGEKSGVFADYHYYGTGDTGGSPREPSVRLVDAIVGKKVTSLPAPRQGGGFGPPPSPAPTPGPEVRVGEGPLKVVSATAEQMFLDITPEQAARLPRYKGDLLLTEHSAGSLTSQTIHKRWNRHNENLADGAERASVLADWLGGRPYPRARLNDAWQLVLGGQMHDIQPGTATAKAFEYAWNDDVIALNQFAGVLTSATESIASALDTQAKGTAVVVYNPLNVPREDVVEASVAFPSGTPKAVRVFGPDGKEVPAQLAGAKVLFLASLPSVGYAVFDVQAAETPAPSTLKATPSSLENARYRLRVDENGDLASVFDKSTKRELLAAPLRLAFIPHAPRDWPAWNMDWDDQQKPPRAYVAGPAQVRVVENGPARVAVEIAREAEGSKFVQTLRLSAGGAGQRVEIANVVDWRTKEAALKATFPLAAANPEATYNWDVGTVRRGNNEAKRYEVPSHQWFDLTDKGGTHGVTVLSDSKYGSDKPDDRTLRLTLLYTPGLGEGNGRAYNDQLTQDWGRHEFVYGLAGHAGDWRRAETDWQAYRLNQPLQAFESPKHAGTLGRSVSLLKISVDGNARSEFGRSPSKAIAARSPGRVRVLALKKAEDGDEVIVRVVETDGKPAAGVRLAFPAPLAAAREVSGQELPLGEAKVVKGELVTDLGAHQLRTFALKLGAAPAQVRAPRWAAVTLPYDRAVATPDGRPSAGAFDNQGRALPAEMLPRELPFAGIQFQLGPAEGWKANAVVARGQSLALPEGSYRRAYVLAASADGDVKATFRAGETPVELTVPDWGGYLGQWDNRVFNVKQEPVVPPPGAPAPPPGFRPRTRTVWEFAELTPGFIKRAPVAWFASHRHTPDGANEPYAYSYLFAQSFELPAGARTITLPSSERLRVLAVTVSDEGAEVRPAQPLYDTLER